MESTFKDNYNDTIRIKDYMDEYGKDDTDLLIEINVEGDDTSVMLNRDRVKEVYEFLGKFLEKSEPKTPPEPKGCTFHLKHPAFYPEFHQPEQVFYGLLPPRIGKSVAYDLDTPDIEDDGKIIVVKLGEYQRLKDENRELSQKIEGISAYNKVLNSKLSAVDSEYGETRKEMVGLRKDVDHFKSMYEAMKKERDRYRQGTFDLLKDILEEL